MTKTEFMYNTQEFVAGLNKYLEEEQVEELEVEELVDMLIDDGYEVTMDDDNIVTFKFEKHLANIEICASSYTGICRVELNIIK